MMLSVSSVYADHSIHHITEPHKGQIDSAWVEVPGPGLIGLGFGPFFQLSESDTDIYGLRINLGYGTNDNVWGLDIGTVNSSNFSAGLAIGGWNKIGTAVGFQLGLINNVHSAYGFQFGGWNTSQEMTGFQIGGINDTQNTLGLQTGLWNNAEKNLKGFQTGLVNSAGYALGLQFGGINVAEEVGGFQLGGWNKAEKK